MTRENLPAINSRLSTVLAEYEAKRAGLVEALNNLGSAVVALERGCRVQATHGQTELWGRGGAPKISINEAERHLLCSGWRAAYDVMNIETIASAIDKARIAKLLAAPPALTVENLRDHFGDLIKDPRGTVLRGLAEVFGGLDPAFKSHERMKIGVKGLPKRVIITGWGGYSRFGQDQVINIINAIAAMQRKPMIGYAEINALKQDGEALRYDKTIPDPNVSKWERDRLEKEGQVAPVVQIVGRGVWLKTYQNGNAHLYFDPETLLAVNSGLAEYYGDVLPDCYAPDEARPARRQSTEVSKDLQFYPTPRAAISIAMRGHDGNGHHEWRGKRVLEPSCGDGRMLDAIRAAGGIAFGVEVDAGRAAEARARGHSVLTANFLEVVADRQSDVVLMNPPFYGRHYEKHVTHACGFLKSGGRLIAILPVTARTDHGLLGADWAEKNGMMLVQHGWKNTDGFYDLPAGSFSESGTNINTVVFEAVKL